jgi:hypothetical protein
MGTLLDELQDAEGMTKNDGPPLDHGLFSWIQSFTPANPEDSELCLLNLCRMVAFA